MLLCIEYGILFVDTANMKIKACNALNTMFVKTVDTIQKVLLKRERKKYEIWNGFEASCENAFMSTASRCVCSPLFEMFYSEERGKKSGMNSKLHVNAVNMRFIRYSKCSTQKREERNPEWFQSFMSTLSI